MYRHELVVDTTANDDESVVGEECHIVSGRSKGPRFDPDLSANHINDLDNLILLCRIHHKMVDDQHETYTAEMLRTLKTNHETWVSSSLTDVCSTPNVRLKRIRKNIPEHFLRLTSGREVLGVVEGADMLDADHDDLISEAEVDLIGDFLEMADDWGNFSTEFEARDRVKIAFRMDTNVKSIHQAGFRVFGGREVQQLEGGVRPPGPFYIAILRILREDNPAIVSLDQTRTLKRDEEKPLAAPPSKRGGNSD